jgi:hypothetical protein
MVDQLLADGEQAADVGRKIVLEDATDLVAGVCEYRWDRSCDVRRGI